MLDELVDLFLDLRLGGEQQFRGFDGADGREAAQDLRCAASRGLS